MNLSSREGLIRRLRRGRDARARLVSSHLDKTIAFQLRAVRDRQALSQGKLAEIVGTNQNAISRLESESYGKATIRTLKRLAAALDVALVVRFVPFSQLVDWVSGTPFVDVGLSAGSLAVPSFKEEEMAGRFEEAASVAGVTAWTGAQVYSPYAQPVFAGHVETLWKEAVWEVCQVRLAASAWESLGTPVYGARAAGPPLVVQ